MKQVSIMLIVSTCILSGCDQSSSGGSNTATLEISWEANKEEQINTDGGGYEVYYSLSPFSADEIDEDSSSFEKIDLPYDEDAGGPTSCEFTVSYDNDDNSLYYTLRAYGILDDETVYSGFSAVGTVSLQ